MIKTTNELFQWDTGVIASVVPKINDIIYEVHFSTKCMRYAYVASTYMQNNSIYVKIPDEILQSSRDIICYEVTRTAEGKKSISETTLTVQKRNKPEDYVYTESERKTYEELQGQIEELTKTVDDLSDKITPSDWEQTDQAQADYIKNKPFYEESQTVFEPLNITWNGNTDGMVVGGRNNYYKVSDLTLTKEQLISLGATYNNGDDTVIDSRTFFITADEYLSLGDSGFIIIYTDGYNGDIEGAIPNCSFPESGLYFPKDGRSLKTTGSVNHTKKVVKQLDNEYIPEEYINELIDDKLGVIENGTY